MAKIYQRYFLIVTFAKMLIFNEFSWRDKALTPY